VPYFVEMAVTLAHADLFEAAAFVKRPACAIAGKGLGLEGPITGCF